MEILFSVQLSEESRTHCPKLFYFQKSGERLCTQQLKKAGPAFWPYAGLMEHGPVFQV